MESFALEQAKLFDFHGEDRHFAFALHCKELSKMSALYCFIHLAACDAQRNVDHPGSTYCTLLLCCLVAVQMVTMAGSIGFEGRQGEEKRP